MSCDRGPEGIRTLDLLIQSQTLYQLSYRPMILVRRPGGSRTLTSRLKRPLLFQLSYKPIFFLWTRPKEKVGDEGIEPYARPPPFLVKGKWVTATRRERPPIVVQVGHDVGRPGGSRTLTSRIKNPLLCRLSYKPVGIEPTAGFAPALSGLQDRRLSRSSHVGI